jgi:hypothetical protein
VRGIDIFKSDVNAIDRYQNPPGMKSMRVPSRRSIHQSVGSHRYGRTPLGFGLTRYPIRSHVGSSSEAQAHRHHWSGGVIGRPVSAGQPLTIPPSQRWCHPLTELEKKEWQ